MKTLKQIADELGIEKQRVYRFIKKNCINEAHQENGVMYYDKKAQTQIQCYFTRQSLEVTASEKSLASASYDVLLKHSELLSKELEIKNEQIKELNARLAEITAALVATHQSTQAAQALHAGTIQQQLTSGADQPPDAEPRKGFFAKWFSSGRNKNETAI